MRVAAYARTAFCNARCNSTTSGHDSNQAVPSVGGGLFGSTPSPVTDRGILWVFKNTTRTLFALEDQRFIFKLLQYSRHFSTALFAPAHCPLCHQPLPFSGTTSAASPPAMPASATAAALSAMACRASDAQ